MGIRFFQAAASSCSFRHVTRGEKPPQARGIWAFESQHIQQRQLHRTTITALAMTSNKYDTLPKDAFRLLTIIDANYYPVKCTLSTFSLDDPPAYMALSYTWGSAISYDDLNSDLNRTLLCDEAEIPITKNLEYALVSMDLTHEHIWADAVCINQQDLAERSAQVALMGRIYSQASQVSVWLGIADTSTQTAFEFIHDFASRVPNEVHDFEQDQRDEFYSDSGLWDKIGRPEWTTAEREALVWVYLRTWFTRTWVLQEVVFANDPVVFCGSNSAPWWAFSVASELASNTSGFTMMRNGRSLPIAAVPPEVMTLKAGCREIAAYINDDNMGLCSAQLLFNAIYATRNMQATEPKDKVFAPIALVLHVLPFEELIARLKPDYSKSIVQVFTEVSSFLLQHDAFPGRGYFLSMAGNAAPSQVEGLPSWVQDFTLLPDNTILPNPEMPDPDSDFNCIAGIGLDMNLDFTPSVSTLRLCASQFDTVSELLLLPFDLISSGEYAELLPLLRFAAALPDFDARGEPAILSMIHSIAGNETREYDNGTVYDKFREIFTHVFGFAVRRGLISADEMLAPGSTFSGLLDDFERRRITAFPTCAELRKAIEDPGFSMKYNSKDFNFIYTNTRQLFQSNTGYIGIISTAAQRGDEIFFLPMSSVPFVFRKMNHCGEYKLVGEAYVHGIMYGELWREGAQPEWSPVTLV